MQRHAVSLDSTGGDVDTGASQKQFELVQVVLVPPPPPSSRYTRNSSGNSSSSSNQVMSAGARQGLLKLLTMCGLDNVTADGDEQADTPAVNACLTTFLPEAAEVSTQTP